MSAPLVSVCLPSFNTLPFLEERVDTILKQTHGNWEMLVVDSSDDGSWEFFEKLARRDGRVSIARAPRGLYESWNTCIRRAQGKYVYIATSDDTMAADCLQKLTAALETNGDCDLASCALEAIDKDGRPLREHGWRDATVFGHWNPGLLKRQHVRRAPFDGLLHLTGCMVHLSVTQLLIRRSLFSRIGEFDGRWGSPGDRHWEMRAGLVANTIHIPDTWATWRVHAKNATAAMSYCSAEYAGKIEQMLADAVEKCRPDLPAQVVAGLEESWLDTSRQMRSYYASLRRLTGFRKRCYQLSQLFASSQAARLELMHRLQGNPKWASRAPGEIQTWLDTLGLGPVIRDGSAQASAAGNHHSLVPA
ncbi:MAG TPA: glycosyltransferase family 2 protein [Terriglobales bacterium]|nr:glycosyltransferase family 2 protein [Terriglobales bacterium]